MAEKRSLSYGSASSVECKAKKSFWNLDSIVSTYLSIIYKDTLPIISNSNLIYVYLNIL